MNVKRLFLLLFVIIPSMSYAHRECKSCFVSYLTVRSSVLDKDSCIFEACNTFLDDTTRNHVTLLDKYLHLNEYDSLNILDEDSTPIGKTLKKIKKSSSTVQSMLGYHVSTEQEKHDMALIQPAAEIYFENFGVR